MMSWLRRLADQLAKENELKQDAPKDSAVEISDEEKKQLQLQKEKQIQETAAKVLETMKSSQENKFQNNFQAATTLKVVKNEDGLPLCKGFTLPTDNGEMRIYVNSVTDGVGGCGASLRFDPVTELNLTEPHLGAHEVQKMMEYYIENHPILFSRSIEEITMSLNLNLQAVLMDMDTRYPTKVGESQTNQFFQTTFSMSIMQETAGSKTVQMIWAGDSPIIIVTPYQIITNTNLDKPWDTPIYNCLCDKMVDLKKQEFISAPDEPLIVIACSDGMTKFRGVFSQLETLIDGVMWSIKSAGDADEFKTNIHTFYNQMPKWYDDATFSITTSIQNKDDLKKLQENPKSIIPLGD